MANTTWNSSDKTASVTLSNLNLTATVTAIGAQACRTGDRLISGKYYWEYTFTTANGNGCGIANAAAVLTSMHGNGGAGAFAVDVTGSANLNGATAGFTIGAVSTGGVVCYALDLGSRLIWVRNGAAGNWNNSGTANPATGVGGSSVASIVGGAIPAYGLMGAFNTTTGAITANFGDTAFTGAVPSGFTSGFTAGASIPTNALATQLAAEHWLTTNPQAQVTQIALEHWATVTGTGLQAIVTQVAIEHWATVAIRTGAPMITMIG